MEPLNVEPGIPPGAHSCTFSIATGKGSSHIYLLLTLLATVPDAVKKELLQHIRDYLDQTQ